MRVWNPAVDHRPAEVISCATVDDVRAGLARAADSGLGVSVLSGGHDWLGRSVRPGGVVLDLSAMRTVTVTGDTVVAGGGARALDVMTVAEEHGYSVVAGTVGSVGVAGFTLGGGYGSLNGLVGTGSDNLLAAEVVLADGRLVHATEQTDPDLLWALRGGGGNFGVVTALHLRAFPITSVLTGMVAFGWDQAAHVLLGFNEICAQAPDEFTARAGVVTLPGGPAVVYVAPAWLGDPAAGEEWMKRITGLGEPLITDLRSKPFSDVLREGEAMFAADKLHHDMAMRNVAALTPEVVATIIEAAEARRSPSSVIEIIQFHGAATRPPVESTAFAQRSPHFLVELIGSWNPEDGASDQDWAREASRKLAPYALPGGYPNLLGPHDDEQVAHAYGPNAERLLAVKRRYDPQSVFTATPLPH
ncbi:FAD/FMN-containing dehydrogenase [Catenuloplanes nepalensis]|uniref:FAD/FMN-containing dehydrogenase n=1 Tax=Catenuloplanes nepalensis TaxID=587533 RepID=A0ABT9MNZ5_9ACTN|nr:FAD-binding oxidoreductase [Catenuloplanes nepalensis]MDP9793154.1 FAD/FMN-containing dehydrogenase [Catenuloplanes nepalensis]